jgi:hypothetical protein
VAEVPANDDEWPHGVQVSMAVRPSDIVEFGNKAREVYQWFEVPPAISGNLAGTVFESPLKQLELGGGTRISNGEGWVTSPSVSQSIVVMGGVCYPLDLQKVSMPAHLASFLQKNSGPHQRAAQFSVVLKLNLGAVFMTPSREGLQYNEATQKAIRVAIQELVSEQTKELLNKVRKARGMPRFKGLLSIIPKGSPIGTSYWRYIKDGVVRELSKEMPLDEVDFFADFLSSGEISLTDDVGSEAKPVRLIYREPRLQEPQSISVIGGKIGSGQPSQPKVKAKISLLDDNVLIVYQDKRGAVGQAKDYIKKSKYPKSVLLFTGGEKSFLDCSRNQNSSLYGAEAVPSSSLAPQPLQKSTPVSTRFNPKKDDPREFFKDREVDVWELGTNPGTSVSAKTAALKDLDPKTTYFLALQNRSKTVWAPGTVLDSFETKEVLSSMRNVLNSKLGGLPGLKEINRKVIYLPQSEIAALRIVEQGYRPLSEALSSALPGVQLQAAGFSPEEKACLSSKIKRHSYAWIDSPKNMEFSLRYTSPTSLTIAICMANRYGLQETEKALSREGVPEKALCELRLTFPLQAKESSSGQKAMETLSKSWNLLRKLLPDNARDKTIQLGGVTQGVTAESFISDFRGGSPSPWGTFEGTFDVLKLSESLEREGKTPEERLKLLAKLLGAICKT